MKNYYSNYEIEFYIDALNSLINEYNDKITMLLNLKDEFSEELKSRGDD